MKNIKILCILLLMTALPTASWAEGYSFGAGNTSCGSFIEAYTKHLNSNENAYFEYIAWVGGYLSAKSEAGNLRRVDMDGAMQFILNYCQKNPLDAVITSTSVLALELRKKN